MKVGREKRLTRIADLLRFDPETLLLRDASARPPRAAAQRRLSGRTDSSARKLSVAPAPTGPGPLPVVKVILATTSGKAMRAGSVAVRV